jgi:hypothetical protein
VPVPSPAATVRVKVPSPEVLPESMSLVAEALRSEAAAD